MVGVHRALRLQLVLWLVLAFLACCGGPRLVTAHAAAAVAASLQARGFEAPALQAAAGADGSLKVAGLRFHGGGLHVLLLGADQSAEKAVSSRVEQQQGLDFEQSFDSGSDSWSVRVVLPAGSTPSRVEVWCRRCTAVDRAGSKAAATGLLQSLQVSGSAATGSTVVLLLEDAALPAAATAASEGSSSVARKLQQAAAPAAAACALTVAGQAYSFASCTSVSRVSGAYSMQIHTTVEPAAPGSLLRVGLVAKTNGGWVGWGLPRSTGSMLGASAVIVWPTATGAEVSGFLIPNSYSEGPVNAAKGTFPIADAAAENVSGELRAVFTINITKASADQVASAPLNYIYAIGPMGASATPGLGNHAVYGRPYGSGTLQVQQAAVATSNATPATAAAATPASASPPPAAAVQPAAQAPAAGPGETVSAGNSSTVAAAGSSAADATGGCTLLLAEGGTPQAYTGCTQISGVGTNFHVLWKTEPPSNSTNTVLTIAMSATSTGYVAVGFPSRAGHMSGSSSMILQTCTAGSAGCTNGAKLSQWYLGSTRQSDVKVDNRLAISNIQAAALPSSGQLVGSFQLEVDSPTAATGRRRRLQAFLQDSDGSMPLIFAAGNLFTDGTPKQHIDEGDASLPMLAPASTDTGGGGGGGDGAVIDGGGGGGGENSALKAAHAWLAAIGWGVFIPVGIVMARSFKEVDPLWFHLHRAIQTLGFVMGTIALGLGFALVEGEWATDDSHNTVHRNLGMACTVLGATQFSAIVLRPKKDAKYRWVWAFWHSWAGRSAAVLAIANIYYGILHMWELGVWPWASYTAVLVVIVGVSAAKDGTDWLRSRKKRGDGGSKGMQLTRPPSSIPHRGSATARDVEAHV